MSSPKLLTIKGVARLTGYKLGSARHLAARGVLPPPVAKRPAKGGRGKPADLWRKSEIAAYVRHFGRNPGRGRHHR